MGAFDNAIVQLNNLGLADVILPFILVFTVVFAILQKTKILGTEDGDNKKPRKNYNVVVALVMGLAVVIPHVLGTYPSEHSDIVLLINNSLPNVSAVLIAVVALLLIIGVFGGEANFGGTSVAGWTVIFALIATVAIFGGAAGWFEFPIWAQFLMNSETQSLVVVILVFGAIIYFITKEDKPKKPGEKSLMEQLGEVTTPRGK